MTDGAARLIELHGTDAMRANAFRKLVSRDPETFWTSGQWMTERGGGSDVSQTATVARKDGEHYRLYGTKWFTSATTSQMTFTLARIEENGKAADELSLFYLETRDAKGKLRDIVVHRLKGEAMYLNADLIESIEPFDRVARASFCYLAARSSPPVVEDVVHQGRLARAADAGEQGVVAGGPVRDQFAETDIVGDGNA